LVGSPANFGWLATDAGAGVPGSVITQVYFERSGGVAGIRLTATIDVRTLPSEEAGKLRQLIEAARFFDLPAVITLPDPGPDRFQYKLTVETEGGGHTVWTDEVAAPSSLRPLLKWLTEAAHTTR
jgi:hypothetical protein